jgi:hypothetical protein
MEMVWVSALLLASVLVWAFVKVLQLALAWKLVQELHSEQELVQSMVMDLDLEKALREWEKE